LQQQRNHFAPPKLVQKQVTIILPPENISWLRPCLYVYSDLKSDKKRLRIK